MSCKEKLSLLVAALCHDIDHPVSNSGKFQIIITGYNVWKHHLKVFNAGCQQRILDQDSLRSRLPVLNAHFVLGAAPQVHDRDRTKNSLHDLRVLMTLFVCNSVRASELMTNDSGTGLLDGLCPGRNMSHQHQNKSCCQLSSTMR